MVFSRLKFLIRDGKKSLDGLDLSVCHMEIIFNSLIDCLIYLFKVPNLW